VKERSKEAFPILHSVDTVDRPAIEWLEVDRDERKIIVTTLPSREQIDTQIQEQLVVELYSK
jgi:small subunit ribosomal protein S4